MNKIHEWINTALIALVIILGLVGGNHQSGLGASATTNLPSIGVAQLDVGSGCDQQYTTCTGSDITKLLTGTMTCATGASSITALASSTYQCAATNVVSGDKVFVTLPVTTPDSIILADAIASSTANGFIVLQLANMSTSTKNVAGATTSVQYFVTR